MKEKKKLINHHIFIYFLTFLFIDLHRSVRQQEKKNGEQRAKQVKRDKKKET